MEPEEFALLRSEVQRLTGLEQIRARINQCARALDRLDRALLEEQFWADARVDYGSFYQGAIAAFLDVAMSFQGSMRDTQHLVGNISIQIAAAGASAESYVHAHHVLEKDGRLLHLIVGARYLDRFACRDGDWRLIFRTEVMDWGRSLPVEDRWFESNDQLPKGMRGRADLSYGLHP